MVFNPIEGSRNMAMERANMEFGRGDRLGYQSFDLTGAIGNDVIAARERFLVSWQ